MINLLKKHKDKLYHFGICFIASIFQPWLAVGLALGKEVYDWFKYGRKLGLVKFLPMALQVICWLMGWVYFACFFSLEGIMADDNGKNCLIGLQNAKDLERVNMRFEMMIEKLDKQIEGLGVSMNEKFEELNRKNHQVGQQV